MLLPQLAQLALDTVHVGGRLVAVLNAASEVVLRPLQLAVAVFFVVLGNPDVKASLAYALPMLLAIEQKRPRSLTRT